MSQLVEQGWPFRAKDQVMVVRLVTEREKKKKKKNIFCEPHQLFLSLLELDSSITVLTAHRIITVQRAKEGTSSASDEALSGFGTRNKTD